MHYKDINKGPSSIHAWAQSDHNALALGFYNDGFDFFHPTTFSLDLQFSARKKLKNPEGITAGDSPVLHYTAAVFVKILGITSTLIICRPSWNSPMVGWQRKVYRINPVHKWSLRRLKNETFDFIVVHNASFSEQDNILIQSYCSQIKSNGKVSICKQK